MVSSGEFLTVAEVADLLKINQQTVRNWITQGYLPAFRLGRRVRILRSDLDELLERSRMRPANGSSADSPPSEKD